MTLATTVVAGKVIVRGLGRVCTTLTTAIPATSTATTGRSAAVALTSALSVGTLSLLSGRLRLAGKLNGDLALQNLLAAKLGDGALGLSGGGEVDEGVANRSVGARVLGNGDGLAVGKCGSV